VTAAVERPVPARQDRSLRAALDHIHAHFCEPLRLARVARIAGFAPSHFSKLFILREKTSFERYVRGLRIERARQLLTGTALHVTRIADLCGFNSLQYFGRAFRTVVGTTPLAYRRNPAGIKSSSQTR
jgi:AraC-like DNA-binding protein